MRKFAVTACACTVTCSTADPIVEPLCFSSSKLSLTKTFPALDWTFSNLFCAILVKLLLIMELLLGKVTQQAMNYAIRSGVTMTATYAIKQSAKLLANAPQSDISKEFYEFHQVCACLLRVYLMQRLLTDGLETRT